MRMSECIVLAAALAAAVPAHAGSTATTRLVATVPPSCSIGILSSSVSDRGLIMMVKRNCNTSHMLVFSANSEKNLGNVTMRYNNLPIDMASHYGSITAPEGYYDRVDRLEIRTTAGSAEDLQRYASTINLAVEVI